MRILLAAPVHHEKLYLEQQLREIKEYGKVINSFCVGQMQHFWEKALKDLGHSVEVFRYSDGVLFNKLRIHASDVCKRVPVLRRMWDISERIVFLCLEFHLRNKTLLRLVSEYKPDLVIISGGHPHFYSETVRTIKFKLGCKTVLFHGTGPYVSEYTGENLKQSVPYFDYIFCNDFYHSIEWKELGVENVKVLPITACDPDFHRNIELPSEEKELLATDVSYLGNMTKSARSLLEQLTEFSLGIWGGRWDKLSKNSKLRKFYKGIVTGEEMVKVYSASKISINVHGITQQWGGNLRTFEIPACSVLQLIDRYDKEWFEEGEEIVSYRDAEDLKRKIRYYLTHEEERQKIATKGQERVYRNHTYKNRMSKMIWLVEQLQRSKRSPGIYQCSQTTNNEFED